MWISSRGCLHFTDEDVGAQRGFPVGLSCVKHLQGAWGTRYHVHFTKAWFGPCLPQTPPRLPKCKVQAPSGSRAPPPQLAVPWLPGRLSPPSHAGLSGGRGLVSREGPDPRLQDYFLTGEQEASPIRLSERRVRRERKLLQQTVAGRPAPPGPGMLADSPSSGFPLFWTAVSFSLPLIFSPGRLCLSGLPM